MSQVPHLNRFGRPIKASLRLCFVRWQSARLDHQRVDSHAHCVCNGWRPWERLGNCRAVILSIQVVLVLGLTSNGKQGHREPTNRLTSCCNKGPAQVAVHRKTDALEVARLFSFRRRPCTCNSDRWCKAPETGHLNKNQQVHFRGRKETALEHSPPLPVHKVVLA